MDNEEGLFEYRVCRKLTACAENIVTEMLPKINKQQA